MKSTNARYIGSRFLSTKASNAFKITVIGPSGAISFFHTAVKTADAYVSLYLTSSGADCA